MPAHSQPDAAIELIDVVKELGGDRILRGADLTVPEGEITVLLGLSGVGKTVLIKHVLGLMEPTSGVVRVSGRDLSQLSEQELYGLRSTMSAVMQGTLPFTCGMFFSLNVYENIAFALRARMPRWTEERVREVTMEHLEMVGIADRADDMPATLSAGMCKRAVLARALALDARIVIVDDFDSGIDAVRLRLLCELIRDMQATSGASFLVTTHDMAAARELADHAAVLHEGRIIAEGDPERVFGSTKPVVHQLVHGETSGPLKLAS